MHVLLVDDDRDQLDIRSLILEHAGHEVRTAGSSEEALASFRAAASDSVVMDLHLPRSEDGLRLIRGLRELSPGVKIVVTTGAVGGMGGAEEHSLVNHVLLKPFKTEKLLRLLAMLLVCVLPCAAIDIEVERPAEMTVLLEYSVPVVDGLAELTLDGKYFAHTAIAPRAAVSLGTLARGRHTLEVKPAPVRAEVVAASAEFARHAPVLHVRRASGTRFTDVPLLTYCEELENEHGKFLQYSAIFSNEDGGTSTRALMARWGRTTDIEHVYRVWPATGRTEIQARGHNDVAFTGRYEDKHPILYVTTENNMVGPEGDGGIRFRPAAVLASLDGASREKVMDDHPYLYGVAARELAAESKLRPFGTVDGQKISDPRNYLYLEARIANRDSRFGVRVRLDGEPAWRTSWLGRADYAIERGGWVRTTVELPPGTSAGKIAEIGADCLVEPPSRDKPAPVAGSCTVFEISKAFLLGSDHAPQPSFWSQRQAIEIPTGATRTWTLR